MKKTRFIGRDPQRGSTLLASMIVIVVLSFAAAAVLSYSLTTYRNSMRQAILDQAKEVADSEMQYLYFTWKEDILTKLASPGLSVDNFLQTHVGSSGIAGTPPPSAAPPSSVTATGYDTTINLTPFTGIAQGLWNGGSWTISRTLQFNPKTVVGSTSTDGSALGIMNGTNGSVGKIFYYTAKTRATFSSPVLGKVEFHSGRNFQFASASLFQYALFYQGDLELAAGGAMTITGPISTNANAYIGSSTAGAALTLTNNLFYFQTYNGATDPLSGEDGRYEVQQVGSNTQTHVNNSWLGGSQTYNGETSSAQPLSLNDPVFNPNPAAAAPVNQTGQRQSQVSQLVQQQNFVGGVDVSNALANYPGAYLNPSSGLQNANEVYRAVIAPPPAVPEDPAVSASRMYNSAGVLITVSEDTTGATQVTIGTAAAPAAYFDTQHPASGVLTAAQYALIVPTVRQKITNKREEAGGTLGLNLTTVDVAGLNDALNSLMPGNTVGTAIPTYNGMVYVYDKTDNNALVAANSALGTGAGSINNTQNAIRLQDGAVTPNFTDTNGNPYGFTVASNNGVYIQGDYNIKQINVGGSLVPNPSAIMGDSITAVSAYNPVTVEDPTPVHGWDPNNSDLPIGNRVAAPTFYPIRPVEPGLSSANVVYSTDYGDSPTGPPNGMTVNAAILTGNTPSYNDPLNPVANQGGSLSYSSGGAQNLVRMEEDWYHVPQALTLALEGSVGQLFSSDYVKGPYRSNSNWPGIGPGGTGSDIVYQQPATRLVNYDPSFGVRTPFGTPTTSNFTIGPFFFW